MDNNVLDPSEVRKSLASKGEFEIEDIISEEKLNLLEDAFDIREKIVIKESESETDSGENIETIITEDISKKHNKLEYPAAAVIIIKDGKILCASRRNNEGICGPGGHVEEGEETEDAAIRETMEEFNIVPLNLQPLGVYKDNTGLYLSSMVYWTDKFSGVPKADNDEMLAERWMSLEELQNQQLYQPFKESLDMLVNLLKNYL